MKIVVELGPAAGVLEVCTTIFTTRGRPRHTSRELAAG